MMEGKIKDCETGALTIALLCNRAKHHTRVFAIA